MKPLTPEEAVKVDRYPVYIGGVQLEKNLQPFMDALRGRPVVEDKWDCPADWDFQFSLTRDFGFSFTKGRKMRAGRKTRISTSHPRRKAGSIPSLTLIRFIVPSLLTLIMNWIPSYPSGRCSMTP